MDRSVRARDGCCSACHRQQQAPARPRRGGRGSPPARCAAKGKGVPRIGCVCCCLLRSALYICLLGQMLVETNIFLADAFVGLFDGAPVLLAPTKCLLEGRPFAGERAQGSEVCAPRPLVIYVSQGPTRRTRGKVETALSTCQLGWDVPGRRACTASGFFPTQPCPSSSACKHHDHGTTHHKDARTLAVMHIQ